MTLLRSFDDHEYFPEYGTFLIRDTGPIPSTRPHVSALLDEHAVATQTCGSVARAGNGWLDGRATDTHHFVRLEIHDEPPAMDADGWTDVVETPMATGGTVGLTLVTGISCRDPFRLGAAGLYRVRFARRPASEGDAYLLQFWPSATPPEPPQWIVRTPTRPENVMRHLTSDLAQLLLWCQQGSLPTTVNSLAERLRVPPDTVRDVLRHAVTARVLEPVDVPDDPDAAVRPTVRGREPQPARHPGPPTRGPSGNVTAAVMRVASGRSGEPTAHTAQLRVTFDGARPQPPAGAPPVTGAVGHNGEVIVWHDGEPVEIARWVGPSVFRAAQSRHGIILIASTQAAILRPGGAFESLGASVSPIAAIDAGGDHLAVVEIGLGRRTSCSLQLIDLRDGTRQTMPGDFPELNLRVLAVADGAVYVDDRKSTLRWRPGSDPEPLPWRLTHMDPFTGIAVATDDEPGSLVVLPGGQTWRIGSALAGKLAPGGTHMVTWTFQPPSLSLTDIAHPDRVDQVPLPDGCSSGEGPNRPIWEDRHHILAATHGRLVRVDVRTRATESIVLPPSLSYRPSLIEPIPSQSPLATAIGPASGR
jgi:hypothetical protein